MNKVVIFCSLKKHQNLKPELGDAARISLRFLKKNGVYLEIGLLSNAAIRSFNRRFRKRDEVTNVLSFPAKKGFPEPSLRRFIRLGEIYLAPDYIKTKGEDIYRLLVHGILHVLGYTHDKSRDTIRMEKMESRIVGVLKQDNFLWQI